MPADRRSRAACEQGSRSGRLNAAARLGYAGRSWGSKGSRAGVPHYWRVDMQSRTSTGLRWTERGYIEALQATRGNLVCAERFDAVELPVGVPVWRSRTVRWCRLQRELTRGSYTASHGVCSPSMLPLWRIWRWILTKSLMSSIDRIHSSA